MDLGLSETQQMLKTSAREFLQAECSYAYVRAMEEDERGYTPEMWRKLADQGWLGLVFPEEYDGAGLSFLTSPYCWRRRGVPCFPAPSSPRWSWAE